jgi:uncharacterized protein YhaN
MRLISCHIDNFGKWSNKDFGFENGINEFFMSNGEGKTTLASFIKAMFYGLKGYTESTKDFVERKHFAPFCKGAFGGSIRFEHNGSEYRIERSFHEKSKASDTISVFRNGSIDEELCKDFVGEILFSLDEESFARTLFITSDDMELSATSGIGASLNEYGESSIDVKKADALMLTAIKKYKALRGNSKGLIGDSEKKIKQYRREIENFEKVDAALGEKYEKRSDLMSEIASLEKSVSSCRDTALLLQKWKNYDVYVSAEKKAKEEIDAIMSRYPRGIPSISDINTAEQTLDNFYKADERLSVTEFGEEKQLRLDELKELFSNGEPSDFELENMNKSYDRARECDVSIKALESNFKNSRDEELFSRFKDGVPSEEALARISELEADYRQKSAKLTEINSASTEKTESLKVSKERKQLLTTVALVGTAAIAVGVALAFALSIFVGVIAVTLGVVTLVCAGFAYVVVRMNDIEKSSGKGNPSLVDIQLEMKNAESELRAALALLGYASGEALSEAARLRSDIERYVELTEAENKRREDICTLISERDEALEIVKNTLSKYSLSSENVSHSIRRLEQMRDEIRMLDGLKKKIDEARKQDTALICRLNDELDLFFASYREGEPDDTKKEIDILKSDSFKLAEYRDAQSKAKRDAQAYMEKEGLSERPVDTQYDVNGLEGSLSEKRRELSNLDRQISDDEDCTSRLDELRTHLAEEEETLAEYKKRHKLLSDCREFLRLSDVQLTERYIAPVKKGFYKYANVIRESLGETVSLDRELNVSFEKDGAIRDAKHLSAGQRAVWALCLRLAFIDELFDGDSPFMILDDPFVSLDAENMTGVFKLLSKLSENRQIIYFTCHESRRI